MMKFKPNQTRTYDGEGYKKRAACLCFKNEREEEVLLVSSSRHRTSGLYQVEAWSLRRSLVVLQSGKFMKRMHRWTSKDTTVVLAGVKGKLGRLLGVFENQDRKHRTYVYILTVTETLEDWEDSVNIGRKREWFKIEDAIKVLQCHKPVHAEYLEKLKLGCSSTNGNSVVPTLPDDNSTLYVTSSQSPGKPSTVR